MITRAIPRSTPVAPQREWPRVWLSPSHRRWLDLAFWSTVAIFVYDVFHLAWNTATLQLAIATGATAGVGWILHQVRSCTSLEPFCALCGRPRAAVDYLVAGSDGSICLECPAHVLALVPKTADQTTQLDRAALFDKVHAAIAALPPTTPCSLSGPLLRSLAELADTSSLEEVGNLAACLHNPAVGVELIDRVPPEELTRALRFMLAALCSDSGCPDRAKVLTTDLNVDDLPPLGRALHLNNEVVFRLDCGATEGELDELARRADEAVALMEGVLASGLRHQPEMARVLGTAAAVRLAKGRVQEGIALLDRARGVWPGVSAHRLRTLGDLRRRLGDLDGAHAAWREALAHVPADSSLARSLSERIAEPVAGAP